MMSGFLEQYHLQKQPVPPRQTGEVIAVRSTKWLMRTMQTERERSQNIIRRVEVHDLTMPNAHNGMWDQRPWAALGCRSDWERARRASSATASRVWMP